ncbi:MAG: TRAP transporter small permease [Planctomycetaceae bacterium]|nr:TRAP transporter small permease [Planctomycetaceae bacterium]
MRRLHDGHDGADLREHCGPVRFSASFSFSEEITSYLFVLLSLIGAAIAAKRGAHLGFTLITDMVSPAARRVMRIVGYLFAVAFSGLLFYYGLLMTISQYQRNQITAGMQWPEWLFGSFVPIGSFFVLVRFLQLLMRTIKGKAV